MAEGNVRAMEITGDLNRFMAETLRLEVRHLARRFGLAVGEYRIEPLPAEDSGKSE